jgi:hypothetical protein
MVAKAPRGQKRGTEVRLTDEQAAQVARALAIVRPGRARRRQPYSLAAIARELLLKWSAEVIADADAAGTPMPVDSPDT